MQAKLGESLPQLTKRFGNPTDSEQHPAGGLGLRFRPAKQKYEVILRVDKGFSVAENYYCSSPLKDGRPPGDVVHGSPPRP